jgi:phenylacetate-CoA ligase
MNHILHQADIQKLQEEKLREMMRYISKHSPYYKELFKTQDINAGEVNTLNDLQQLPFTTKAHLHAQNEAFICVPQEKIIDYVTTSGTTGKPVTIVMTEKDLERLAWNECESLSHTGGSPKEIYQLMTSMDRRFMAGLAYFLGARKLGAGVVRVGNGNPELQWDTIQRIKPTVLIAVPSFLVRLIEYADSNGIDLNQSSVKKAVCIGEALRNADFFLNTLGQQISSRWNIQLHSSYASTEMASAFTECEAGKGGHLQPELVIAELIGEDDKPVKDGEPGELVITTLGVEGMPLLRFRTGDLCMRFSDPCSCGRNTLRLGPILGRKNQMIKYKGTTLYPPAVFDVLNHVKEVSNYILELSTNALGTDDLLVRMGCNNPSETLMQQIADHFRARLRVTPILRFEEPEVISKEQMPEMSRKPILLIDKRRE